MSPHRSRTNRQGFLSHSKPDRPIGADQPNHRPTPCTITECHHPCCLIRNTITRPRRPERGAKRRTSSLEAEREEIHLHRRRAGGPLLRHLPGRHDSRACQETSGSARSETGLLSPTDHCVAGRRRRRQHPTAHRGSPASRKIRHRPALPLARPGPAGASSWPGGRHQVALQRYPAAVAVQLSAHAALGSPPDAAPPRAREPPGGEGQGAATTSDPGPGRPLVPGTVAERRGRGGRGAGGMEGWPPPVAGEGLTRWWCGGAKA